MRLYFLGVLVLLNPLPVQGDIPGGKEFRWRTDLEPARREALASGKPLLLVFR